MQIKDGLISITIISFSFLLVFNLNVEKEVSKIDFDFKAVRTMHPLKEVRKINSEMNDVFQLEKSGNNLLLYNDEQLKILTDFPNEKGIRKKLSHDNYSIDKILYQNDTLTIIKSKQENKLVEVSIELFHDDRLINHGKVILKHPLYTNSFYLKWPYFSYFDIVNTEIITYNIETKEQKISLALNKVFGVDKKRINNGVALGKFVLQDRGFIYKTNNSGHGFKYDGYAYHVFQTIDSLPFPSIINKKISKDITIQELYPELYPCINIQEAVDGIWVFSEIDIDINKNQYIDKYDSENQYQYSYIINKDSNGQSARAFSIINNRIYVSYKNTDEITIYKMEQPE